MARAVGLYASPRHGWGMWFNKPPVLPTYVGIHRDRGIIFKTIAPRCEGLQHLAHGSPNSNRRTPHSEPRPPALI